MLVSINNGDSPHRELREDNQSLFYIFSKLFLKLYHFLYFKSQIIKHISKKKKKRKKDECATC